MKPALCATAAFMFSHLAGFMMDVQAAPLAARAVVAHEHAYADVRPIASKQTIRRYERKLRKGDKLLGPAPGANSENAFMEGIGQVLGGGVGGGSGGCAVDYTTPNPTGCRASRYAAPPVDFNHRPQKPRKRSKQASTGKGGSSFKCFSNGKPYVSSTYRMGCYKLDYEKPGTRLSDGLNGIK